MAEELFVSGSSKKEKYESLIPQVKALVEGERDIIANLSNICAAIKYGMDFFWVGFYFVKQEELVLGPFQGPVACTRIKKGKGVCGTAWQKKETIIVDDVEKFPGHIACSSLSRSEIVIPGFDEKGNVLFVLDVDDDKYSTFDETDRICLTQIIRIAENCFRRQE